MLLAFESIKMHAKIEHHTSRQFMQAERLLEFAQLLKADFKSTDIVAKLTNFANQLQAQIQNPAHPPFQTQVAETREEIKTALSTSATNDFVPSLRKILHDCKLEDFFGNSLLDQFNSILSKNSMTPAEAQKEIVDLKDRVNEAKAATDDLISGMEWFEIASSHLSPGEFEIDVTIPRRAVDNELGQLGSEFSKINRIVGFFSEITTGSRENAKLIGISTTDPTVFLQSAPATAAAFAVAVERAVALYGKILNIRKMHRDLKESGMSDKELKSITDHIETTIKKGLEEHAKEIDKIYLAKVEQVRRQELANETRMVLGQIAERLDDGFSFDVRGRAPKPDSESAEESNKALNVVEQQRPKLLSFEAVDGPVLKLSGGEKGQES